MVSGVFFLGTKLLSRFFFVSFSHPCIKPRCGLYISPLPFFVGGPSTHLLSGRTPSQQLRNPFAHLRFSPPNIASASAVGTQPFSSLREIPPLSFSPQSPLYMPLLQLYCPFQREFPNDLFQSGSFLKSISLVLVSPHKFWLSYCGHAGPCPLGDLALRSHMSNFPVVLTPT